MGAWGPDTFENDAALDWLYELEDGGMPHVQATIDRVLETAGYLDADLGCEGLAACDVIARLHGRTGQRDAYTAELDAWVAARTEVPDSDLTRRASAVIDRVLGPSSELVELWDDGDGGSDWTRAVEALRQRLAET